MSLRDLGVHDARGRGGTRGWGARAARVERNHVLCAVALVYGGACGQETHADEGGDCDSREKSCANRPETGDDGRHPSIYRLLR